MKSHNDARVLACAQHEAPAAKEPSDVLKNETSGRLPTSERFVGIQHLLLLLVVVPLLPFFLSGIVRTTLGTTIGAALAVATAATLGLAFASQRWLRRRKLDLDRRMVSLAAALLGLGFVLSAWGLWNPWFSGMPSVGGNDTGIHVMMRRSFLNDDPHIYHGFVTLYSFTHWTEQVFRLDAFGSFRLAFYLVVGIVWLTLTAAVSVVQSDDRRLVLGARSTLSLLLLVAGSGLAILLPLLHYYQAEGFFALLFSIAPLMLAWVAYGIAETAIARLVVLVAWLVAERFTYGINLADGLLTTAFLVAGEGCRQHGIRRGLAFAFALAPVAAAAVFCRQLGSFVQPVGGSYSVRITPLLAGEALLSAFLLVLPSFAPQGRRSASGRLAQFAGTSGVFNVVGQILWLASTLPVGYYFYRYSMQAAVLLTGAAVVLGPVSLNGATARHGAVTARSLATLLLTGLVALGWAFPRHQDSFFERMLKGPPWRHLKPLADLDGMARIRGVLAAEKKRCTVVLAPSWPTVFFMNASLDCPKGPAWDASMDSDSWKQPGGCVFWYGGPRDIEDMGWYATPHDPRRLSSEEAARNTAHVALGHRAQRLAGDLNAHVGKVCDEYTARWDPRRQLRLCHLCF